VKAEPKLELIPNPPIDIHTPDERMITSERWWGIEHQLAVLRRGDRLLAMTAGILPLTIQATDVTSAALAMGRVSDLRIESGPARVDSIGRVRAAVEVPVPTTLAEFNRPSEPAPNRQPIYSEGDLQWMASLEVQAPGLRARGRESARAPEIVDGFGVSDIVLVRDDFETSGDSLLDAMLPSTTLAKSQPVGLYFEVYGVRAGEQLRFAVSSAPTSVSLAQRLAGALRLRSDNGLDVSWTEPAQESAPGRMTRFLGVQLTNLEDGSHEILVTVTRADDSVASASRVVRVVP
jgi:hypothetical protein